MITDLPQQGVKKRRYIIVIKVFVFRLEKKQEQSSGTWQVYERSVSILSASN